MQIFKEINKVLIEFDLDRAHGNNLDSYFTREAGADTAEPEKWVTLEGAMKRVSSTEARNRFDAILDEVQQESVVVCRKDQAVAVILSTADYERLRAGNIQAFLDLRNEVAAQAAANGLTGERLTDLLTGDDACTVFLATNVLLISLQTRQPPAGNGGTLGERMQL